MLPLRSSSLELFAWVEFSIDLRHWAWFDDKSWEISQWMQQRMNVGNVICCTWELVRTNYFQKASFGLPEGYHFFGYLTSPNTFRSLSRRGLVVDIASSSYAFVRTAQVVKQVHWKDLKVIKIDSEESWRTPNVTWMLPISIRTIYTELYSTF